MSAGEAAAPRSFFCFLGLLGLEWDEGLLLPDLALG